MLTTVVPDARQQLTELFEVTASESPQALAFLVATVLRSPARSAAYELAAAFDVAQEALGEVVRRACADLDRLERIRRPWHDPAETLGSINLAALFYVCRARRRRVPQPRRARHLEVILHRLDAAYRLARSRAWIEAFLAEPSPNKPREAHDADR